MQQQKEQTRLEVREGWKQAVSGRDVAIAIGITTVLLCGIGVWVTTLGAAPAVPYQVAGAFLIFVWTMAISTWVRLLQRRLWRWQDHKRHGFFLVALTVFMLPLLGVVLKDHWIGNLGMLLLFLYTMGTIVVWRRSSPASVTPP
nr:hypothetical protein [Armatimonas sp.]